jgi:hypothetical protein
LVLSAKALRAATVSRPPQAWPDRLCPGGGGNRSIARYVALHIISAIAPAAGRFFRLDRPTAIRRRQLYGFDIECEFMIARLWHEA